MKKQTNKELIAELRERGYFVSRVPPTASGKTFTADLKQMRGRRYRFGVISCTHIGSKYQQMSHLYTFYKICQRKGIKEVYHCGDIVEGERIYRGQEYEIFAHGADAQVAYAVDNYPRVSGIRTRVIMGNHDEAFWRTSGVHVVKSIARQRDDIEYIGDYLAYINLDSIKIALMHADGGVAYARSYKVQKIIEQLSPSNKPHMIFIGHWHVKTYLPAYRNVEGYSVGAFQSQTPYMTRKGLTPNVGGWIIEVQVDDSGLLSVKSEFKPFYIMKKNDY